MSDWSSLDKLRYAADVVAEATGVHVEALMHSRRRLGHIMTARKMLIMVCRKYYGLQYSELAEHMNWAPSVFVRHYHTGVAQLRTNPEFAAVWDVVSGHVLRNIQRRRLKRV